MAKEKASPEVSNNEPQKETNLVFQENKTFFKKWIDIIARIVLAASILTALTPSVVDNQHMQKILDALNTLALNVGLNVNHDAMKAAQDAADDLVTESK